MFERIRRARQHDLGGHVHLAEEGLGCELEHLGALAVRDLDKAHVRKRLHRFADRRSADLKPLHQHTFRRHFVARLQFAAFDQGLQAGENLVREFPANNGFWLADHVNSTGA
ncbi:hypothetical protein FQZ97_1235110 [compost metagenome]